MFMNYMQTALRILFPFLAKKFKNLIKNTKEKQSEKERLISEDSPEKLLGYFSLKNLNDSLGCKKYLDLMQTATNFRFNLFDMVVSLVYARVVCSCS